MWNFGGPLLLSVIFYLQILQNCLGESRYDWEWERIVNSTETTIEEYPFTVSIQWCKYHICGGVIVSEEYVLTSARCIEKFKLDELKILAGSTARNDYEPPAQVVEVAKIIQNDDYDSQTWQSDMAILVLTEPLILSHTIQPIEFYEGPLESNIPFTGIGWGVLEEGASFYPINLHAKAMLAYPSIYECAMRLEKFDRLVDPESMICISAHDPDINAYTVGGTCDGDWGGPLVTTLTAENTQMKLVGLASWGFKCDESYPHIFTNLQNMQTFIYIKTGLWRPDPKVVR